MVASGQRKDPRMNLFQRKEVMNSDSVSVDPPWGIMLSCRSVLSSPIPAVES